MVDGVLFPQMVWRLLHSGEGGQVRGVTLVSRAGDDG
jgi:hypothetical protein